MKIILYMALTVNGMIAKSNGDSSWVSSEDADSFLEICQRTGVAIMGRHTYDYLTIGENPEGLPLTDGLHVVLSSKNDVSTDRSVVFLNESPREVLHFLKEKGYKEACLVGGATTVSKFFKEQLVDEVYFDIEPLLFGKGIPLLNAMEFACKLELLDTHKINQNTIQVHYRVVK